MVDPNIIAAGITCAAGAFAGAGQALSSFNDKLNQRFLKVDEDISELKNYVIRDYVLKQDFLREMHSVHDKLDRILDYLLAHKN